MNLIGHYEYLSYHWLYIYFEFTDKFLGIFELRFCYDDIFIHTYSLKDLTRKAAIIQVLLKKL